MSRKCPVFISVMLCALFLFTSCSDRNHDKIARTFEAPFSAVVDIDSNTSAYSARVTLSDIDSVTSCRDGSVQFLSPDSISDIYASRNDSVVKVGVSGIEPTPSPEIAEKYVRLLDILDLRSEGLVSVGNEQYQGIDGITAVFSSKHGEVRVFFDSEYGNVISLSCGEIQMHFSEFVYL